MGILSYKLTAWPSFTRQVFWGQNEVIASHLSAHYQVIWTRDWVSLEQGPPALELHLPPPETPSHWYPHRLCYHHGLEKTAICWTTCPRSCSWCREGSWHSDPRHLRHPTNQKKWHQRSDQPLATGLLALLRSRNTESWCQSFPCTTFSRQITDCRGCSVWMKGAYPLI